MISRWGSPVPDIRHAGPYPLPCFALVSTGVRKPCALQGIVSFWASRTLPRCGQRWACGLRTPHTVENLRPWYRAPPGLAGYMPCDVHASVFANVPEVSIVPVGTRYFLTLLPNHLPQPDASTHTPSGWGWVDDRLEGLAAAMRRHNVSLDGYSIWRRTDGVMVCARDAATGSKLMALVNRTAAGHCPLLL